MKSIAKRWKISGDCLRGRIHPKPGPTAVELFTKFANGEIKCLWVVCTNPGQSLPNLEKYRKGMAREDTFLVVSEAYFPTRTSELADLVLPAALLVREGRHLRTI
jgi:nitrate reductase NapA